MAKEIYFAGGCFWGVEKYFSLISGVINTQVGYANGNIQNPTYQQVCRDGTGHAETVKIVYDENKVPLTFLLAMLYKVIDPTSYHRQGNDVGPQYRTGIYYTDATDAGVIRQSLQELQTHYQRKLAIEAKPLENYYPAEDYHQNYLDKNPSGYCHIHPSAFTAALQAKPGPQYAKKSTEELKGQLSGLQFEVTQHGATEPPFKNEYNDNFEEGIYVDVTTGQPLFVSTDKFESGCGWPAFSKPIDESLVQEVRDTSHGMVRTEVRSKLGEAHLGHVFDDGPSDKGGLRYCINSASLRFVPKEEMRREGYEDYLKLL